MIDDTFFPFDYHENCELDLPDIPNKIDDMYCSCFCPIVKDSYTLVAKFKICTECKKEYKGDAYE